MRMQESEARALSRLCIPLWGNLKLRRQVSPAGMTAGSGDIPGNAYRLAVIAIFLVAIVLRVLRARLPDDTFYADDVFQILEPAHRLAFGYGYVAWEFVAGVRNWLLPGLLALILGGLNSVGLGQPEAYGPVITGFAILISLLPIDVARRSAQLLGGTRAGLLATAGAAIYPPLLFASQKITPEVLAGYALAAALLFALKTGRRSAAASGLLGGIVSGLRIHYAPALLVIVWIVFVRRQRDFTSVAIALASGAAAFSMFGVVDWLTWGMPFISYLRAIEVNILYGVAAQFGEMPPYFYIAAFPFGISLALIAALDWQRTRWLLVPIFVILLAHSLIGHKEPRFVFAIHALTVTAIAIPLADWIRPESARRLLGIGICLCSIFVCLKSYLVSSQPDALLVADYRAVISQLRAEPDMRALAAYGVGRYNFPGAYWLHRNIPIIQDEYVPPQGVPPGVTHIIVGAGTPDVDGFQTMRAFDHLELRKRLEIVPEAPLPPIDWSMPAIFAWR
ncbi:MAG: mannosyltransferase [Proteobacteria bacterium]|nr:mannosyltransferase [Pseudomonadota bacterium]